MGLLIMWQQLQWVQKMKVLYSSPPTLLPNVIFCPWQGKYEVYDPILSNSNPASNIG
jgi:hypothetical protein